MRGFTLTTSALLVALGSLVPAAAWVQPVSGGNSAGPPPASQTDPDFEINHRCNSAGGHSYDVPVKLGSGVHLHLKVSFRRVHRQHPCSETRLNSSHGGIPGSQSHSRTRRAHAACSDQGSKYPLTLLQDDDKHVDGPQTINLPQSCAHFTSEFNATMHDFDGKNSNVTIEVSQVDSAVLPHYRNPAFAGSLSHMSLAIMTETILDTHVCAKELSKGANELWS